MTLFLLVYGSLLHPSGTEGWIFVVVTAFAFGGMVAIFTLWRKKYFRSALSKGIVLAGYIAYFEGVPLIRDSGRTGLADWGLLADLVAVTFLFIIPITGFWRRWIFWAEPPADERKASIVVGAAAALVMLTICFSVATGVLVAKGEIEPKPHMHSWVFAQTEEHYAWEFLNAVPALDITKTLDWRTGYTWKGPLAGSLLLLYKLLVILPLVTATKLLLDYRRNANASDRPPALEDDTLKA